MSIIIVVLLLNFIISGLNLMQHRKSLNKVLDHTDGIYYDLMDRIAEVEEQTKWQARCSRKMEHEFFDRLRGHLQMPLTDAEQAPATLEEMEARCTESMQRMVESFKK
jgi:hypothetical protein